MSRPAGGFRRSGRGGGWAVPGLRGGRATVGRGATRSAGIEDVDDRVPVYGQLDRPRPAHTCGLTSRRIISHAYRAK